MQVVEINVKMLLDLLAGCTGRDIVGPVGAVAGHVGIGGASSVSTGCPSALRLDGADGAHQHGSQ